MIALDTNVVVRYLVQDDPAQAAIATETIDALTEAAPAFVSLVTFVELYWVLDRAYQVARAQLLDTLDALLGTPELVVEQSGLLRHAVRAARDGAGFADAVIVEAARRAACDSVVTFDRAAARHGMTLLA